MQIQRLNWRHKDSDSNAQIIPALSPDSLSRLDIIINYGIVEFLYKKLPDLILCWKFFAGLPEAPPARYENIILGGNLSFMYLMKNNGGDSLTKSRTGIIGAHYGFLLVPSSSLTRPRITLMRFVFRELRGNRNKTKLYIFSFRP